MAKNIGYVMPVSARLFGEPLLLTDLDGKTATLDEAMMDQLHQAYGGEPRYRWPEPVPPEPPTRSQRLRRWIADRLRSAADRIWYVDTYEEEI
jgi:hypothetical protein